MAPNSPACSFIHASMRGSRSRAPLNRKNPMLVALRRGFRDLWLHTAIPACRLSRMTASQHLSPSRHLFLAKFAPGPYAEIMTKLMSKAICLYFLSAPIVGGGEAMPVAMTAERWQTRDNAEYLRELGFYHGLMRLNSGNAVLKDFTFGDGTIEFDVLTIGRGAPGIAFRQQDEANFELLYLRPDPNCPAFPGLHPICAADPWRTVVGLLSAIRKPGAATG